VLRNCKRSIASGLICVLTLATIGWAAPAGAARYLSVSRSQRAKTVSGNGNSATSFPAQKPLKHRIPRTVVFSEVPGRGLLVKLWVNGFGPYTFALDTGAGASIVSSRVATQAGVAVKQGSAGRIAGLSGIPSRELTSEVKVENLAVGERDNFLPANGTVLKADIFPSDIDGILDPTESYWPLGYVIDFPRRELSAFDPGLTPLRSRREPPGGAIVPWVRDSNSRRPYVVLDDGQRALIDTGSEFGLALSDNGADRRTSNSSRAVQDLGGGTISARRVAPLTVAIGSLMLRRIPTDLVTGAERGAPALLGRAALRPFRLSFDPISRLIEIAPVARAGER